MSTSDPHIDILILGAGWTSTFLIPLLQSKKVAFAATTRDGRPVANTKTIKWSFRPDSQDPHQFSSLPRAHNILIAFPLTTPAQSRTLVSGYAQHHSLQPYKDVLFIQLGSTGIWQIPQKSHWTNRHSPYDTTNARAQAEDALLSLNQTVLNLAGLYGGPRDPRTWVNRVAKSKDDVKSKKSVHLIHGVDVARGILAVTKNWDAARGQRYMLTDGLVYDWWELFVGWAKQDQEDEDPDWKPSEQAKWVYDLMWEENVSALPRSMETLGRCYDSRDFWRNFGIMPLKSRI